MQPIRFDARALLITFHLIEALLWLGCGVVIRLPTSRKFQNNHSDNYNWADGVTEYASSSCGSAEEGQPKAMTYTAAEQSNPEFGEEVCG